MTTLRVQRDKGWTDKLRNYQVLLDGVKIGELAEGAELLHQIEVGRHVIEATIDQCGSQPFTFEADSEGVTVTVRSALRGWRVFLSLFYIVFNRRGYLIVESTR